MNTVAMALFPDFLLLDMAGPLEVFSVANRYLPPEAHYQILTIGTEPGPLRASNGVVVHADLLLYQLHGSPAFGSASAMFISRSRSNSAICAGLIRV